MWPLLAGDGAGVVDEETLLQALQTGLIDKLGWEDQIK